MKQAVKKDVGKSKPNKEREKLKKEIIVCIKIHGGITLDEIYDHCSSISEYEFLKAMVELFEEDALDSADGCYFLYRPVWERYD